VNFSGRNHGRHATVQAAVHPAELILPRRPVTANGVHVAVDQSRRNCCAFRIDGRSRTGKVDFFFSADRLDRAVPRDDCVRIQNRLVEISAEKQSDVADDEFARSCFDRRIVAHGFMFRTLRPRPQIIPDVSSFPWSYSSFLMNLMPVQSKI